MINPRNSAGCSPGPSSDGDSRNRAEEVLCPACFDGAPLAFMIADASGRYVDVNPAACRISGYERSELLAMSFADLLAPESLERGLEHFSTVKQTGRATGEVYWIRKDGSKRLSTFDAVTLSPDRFVAYLTDITDRSQAQDERRIAAEFLHLANLSTGKHDLIRMATRFFQEQSDCEAVGIRLREGDDYPYYQTLGFSHEFVQAENSLCVACEDGKPLRDDSGNPILACMCGNVICGRFDPSKPFFSPGGSFWSNCTTDLLASTTAADRQARTRNRCNGEGYESVALIPLHCGVGRLGLLQLNDRRKGRFSAEKIAFWERLSGYLAVALARTIAEERLRQSENRYRSLFEQMTEGFALHEILCDAKGQPYDYRFLDVNPAFEQLTGLRRSEVVGRTLRQVLPGEDTHWIQTYGAVALTGRPARFQDYSAPLNKHFDVFAYRPAPGQFAAMFTDVTQRIHAEQSLRQSETAYRTLFESMTQGAFRQRADGTLLDANPAACRMFGLTLEQFLGRTSSSPAWDVTHEDGSEFPGHTYPSIVALEQGRPVQNVVAGVLNPQTGQRVWMELNAIPEFRPGESRPHQVLVTMHDITGRKRSESDKLEMERRLLHAQKLESLGILAGGIAHDFNNILAGIMGYTDLSLMKLAPDEPVRDHIEVIKKSVRRAADLTRQMLAYAGKGRFVVAPVNLSRVVKDMLPMLDVSLSKKATLTCNLAADLPAIQADASQIHQVVLNLAINASEALGEQAGAITITIDALQFGKADLLPFSGEGELPEGHYVRLDVSDTGCGMDDPTLARIFDPFFTTKFTGRGLGLAALHGIVRAHNGGVCVTNQLGQGTCFQVIFPASTIAPADHPSETAATSWRGSGTVLVVDDEEVVCDMAGQMIKEAGFAVLTARDGAQALQIYRQHHREIVCVLLDLTMPRMDGLEALAALRRIRPDARVILSSGYSQEGSSEHFVSLRLAGFIQKPYEREALLGSLRKAVADIDPEPV